VENHNSAAQLISRQNKKFCGWLKTPLFAENCSPYSRRYSKLKI